LNKYKFARLVIICFFIVNCSSRLEKAIPWPFDEDKFVFIEHREVEEGRVLQGDFPPGRMIDFPTYTFDPQRGTLASHRLSFEINDTLKVIIGKRFTLRGAAGGGVASRLHGVYGFPHKNMDLVLHGIDNNGSAHVEFQNKRLIIKSSDEWKHSVTWRDTIDTSRDTAIAEFTQTIRIINYGVLDKVNIYKW